MKLIDTHTHCFPDALASRAIGQLEATCGIAPCTDGTLAGLLRSMDERGVYASVVCNIATNPRQQDSVNRFAVSQKSNRILSLGSVHPACEDKTAAVEAIAAAGLDGIKLHPDYMGTMFDSDAFEEIFCACERLGLPLLTHAGYDPLSPELVHCPPKQLAGVIARHHDLRLIAAHLGGQGLGEEVLRVLAGKPLWIDTAMLHLCDRATVRKILLSHDPDRILFGSDTPWGSPATQWELIKSFGLPDALLEKIAHGNAEALFPALRRKAI